MLKLIRRTLAAIFWLGITFLFLDISGVGQTWFGWMAKAQFLPNVMQCDILVTALLIILTLLMGRIYCSIICPAGVLQDFFAWIASWKLFRRNKKSPYPNRYHYSKPKTWLRIAVLVVFVAMIIAGFNAVYVLIAPYSAYGRMVTALLQPHFIDVNNMLAGWSETEGNYYFYTLEQNPVPTVLTWVASVSALVLLVLSVYGGRTYCNTICPVGTVLSFFARFSWLKIQVDEDKCIKCGICSRNCKSACIMVKKGQPVSIDYSRCVVCGKCETVCSKQAISLRPSSFIKKTESPAPQTASDNTDISRRNFLAITAGLLTSAALKAEEKTTDGGLAVIEAKKIPSRQSPLTPPGSFSARNVQQRCTACQLCIAKCPNGVLRPSTNLESLFQPEMQYDKGYCRPECTICSDVCPAGAIRPITVEEKTAVQIGHAVFVKENCIPFTDGVSCGNCAHHCPSGAIQMVPDGEGYTLNVEENRWYDAEGNRVDTRSVTMIPSINTERCIGCGACEYLCPSRPFSAIYVEGHEVHREI